MDESLSSSDHETLAERQIKTLTSLISLNEKSILTRKRICQTLDSIISPTSAVAVHIFGSSANGLGVKGCDLDVFMQTTGKF